MTFTCLVCFHETTTDKVAGLSCATCTANGDTPIWRGEVTVSDAIVDGVPEGRVHTLILPDDKVAVTADELEAVLTDDSDEHEVVADAAMAAAMDLPEEKQDDKGQHILGILDAMVADESPEAKAWVEKRMEVSK